MWIHQQKNWPEFNWSKNILGPKLIDLNESIRKWHPVKKFIEDLKEIHGLDSTIVSHELEIFADSVVNSSNIEGEFPDPDEVRNSISGRLKDISKDNKIDGYLERGEWDGMIDMILDVNLRCHEPLTRERIFNWHANMFPNQRNIEGQRISAGEWRDCPIIIGSKNKYGQIKIVHYEAPSHNLVPNMMERFLNWFETEDPDENLFVKAGIAHLWFELIHPFEDGNGRIGRAICDMMLARGNIKYFGASDPFHNLTRRIAIERADYYLALENQCCDSLNITPWLEWFLGCLVRSVAEDFGYVLDNVGNKIKVLNFAFGKGINQRQRVAICRMCENSFARNLNKKDYVKITGCSSAKTAQRDISNLVDIGLLIQNSSEGKAVSYRLATWDDIKGSI